MRDTHTMTKPTIATPSPAPDTVEHNYGNAAAIRAAKIAEYHKAMTDGSLGNALPDVYKPGRFVLGDGTIIERK
jgi:hypothetical protein